MKVRFSGGLGNQLYQLGFLWHLQKQGLSVEPDFCEYTYYDFHCGLELNKILKTEYDDEILKVEASRKQWYQWFNEKLGFWLRYHYYRKKSEKHLFLEDEKRLLPINEIPQHDENLIIKGHWQRLTYLDDVEDKFRSALTYNGLNTPQDEAIVKMIQESESVSLHIRRGDYLKEPQYLVIKDFDYYYEGMDLVKQEHPNAHFFVFSDDMAYVRERLKGDEFVFVDWNAGKNSFKDMLLMTLCKHNIIANSTFSWWGAFLNPNPGKMVICPDKWVIGEQMDDKVPDCWIKIKV